MYSCDFNALYTRINSEKCINIITDFINKLLNNKDFNIIAFNQFLKLVFYNNIFSYKNKFYKQKMGISMGIIW